MAHPKPYPNLLSSTPIYKARAITINFFERRSEVPTRRHRIADRAADQRHQQF
jgi:hypothetical protein